MVQRRARIGEGSGRVGPVEENVETDAEEKKKVS